MRTFLTALLVLSLGPIFVQAADPTLETLVEQLGNARFAERERAMNALRERGPVAAPLLEKAILSKDLEVRRRARVLLDELGTRQETQQLLAPRKLRLQYKNVPITQAVEDFAQRSGFLLSIELSEQARFAKRQLTLETGELPAWEALHKLCEAAGLCEVPLTIPVEPTPVPLMPEEGRRRRRVVWLDTTDAGKERTPQRPIVLKEGKANTLPTALIGALRIQVADPAHHRPAVAANQIGLTLLFDTESQVRWYHPQYVRLESVVDSLGRQLKPGDAYIRELRKPLTSEEEVVLLWDGVSPLPFAPAVTRHAVVRLGAPDRKTPLLREVKGVLGAEVETTAEILLTIDNLFKSVGKTFAGKDGTRVRLVEANVDKDDCYRLRVEVTRPAIATELLLGPGVRLARINRRGAQEEMNTLTRNELEQHGLALRDSKGERVPLTTGEVIKSGQGATREYLLYFHALKGQSSPMKFEVSGRRMTLIEVPFTLKDVPLP